uniref:Uncharacterized protein n=1 Tax=Anopheles dirus TaxID=7168 RepID=A0A182NXH4_9DIPT
MEGCAKSRYCCVRARHRPCL